MTAEVVTLGETMLALRTPGILGHGSGLTASIAGAETNVAIGLARLGHTVSWIGRVGQDQPGAVIRSTLRAEGIRTDQVYCDSATTGIIVFEQRLPTVTRVSYARSGSAGSRIAATDVEIDPATRILHCTGITAALSESAAEAVATAIAQAAEGGVRVSFDVNYRSRLWSKAQARNVLRPWLADIDILIGSPDELLMLTDTDARDEAVAELIDIGVGEVVVKDGGATASVSDGHAAETVSAYSVDVVDPVGAGDAFVAGYLSGVLDDLAPADRLRRAHALGAFAISSVGDWEGLPTRAELPLIMAEEGAVLR